MKHHLTRAVPLLLCLLNFSLGVIPPDIAIPVEVAKCHSITNVYHNCEYVANAQAAEYTEDPFEFKCHWWYLYFTCRVELACEYCDPDQADKLIEYGNKVLDSKIGYYCQPYAKLRPNLDCNNDQCSRWLKQTGDAKNKCRDEAKKKYIGSSENYSKERVCKFAYAYAICLGETACSNCNWTGFMAFYLRTDPLLRKMTQNDCQPWASASPDLKQTCDPDFAWKARLAVAVTFLGIASGSVFIFVCFFEEKYDRAAHKKNKKHNKGSSIKVTGKSSKSSGKTLKSKGSLKSRKTMKTSGTRRSKQTNTGNSKLTLVKGGKCSMAKGRSGSKDRSHSKLRGHSHGSKGAIPQAGHRPFTGKSWPIQKVLPLKQASNKKMDHSSASKLKLKGGTSATRHISARKGHSAHGKKGH